MMKPLQELLVRLREGVHWSAAQREQFFPEILVALLTM